MSSLTPSESDPVRISLAEYERLIEEGVLGEDDRVELLEGVIVPMTPAGPRHEAVSSALHFLLQRALGDRARVRPQMSLVTGSHSLPQPDLCVVAGDPEAYVDERPREALLVVEVAASSLKLDRLSKARVYAAAGVQDYWIVDLRHDTIELHRRPERGRARYAEIRVARRGDSISPLAFPDVVLAVDDVLLRPR